MCSFNFSNIFISFMERRWKIYAQNTQSENLDSFTHQLPMSHRSFLLVNGAENLTVIISGTSSEGYTCQITNQGMRIHETASATPYDCRDNSCGNTCLGGQCVAYVTCQCTRNGNYVPNTSCWRPGTKLKVCVHEAYRINFEAHRILAVLASVVRAIVVLHKKPQ